MKTLKALTRHEGCISHADMATLLLWLVDHSACLSEAELRIYTYLLGGSFLNLSLNGDDAVEPFVDHFAKQTGLPVKTVEQAIAALLRRGFLAYDDGRRLLVETDPTRWMSHDWLKGGGV